MTRLDFIIIFTPFLNLSIFTDLQFWHMIQSLIYCFIQIFRKLIFFCDLQITIKKFSDDFCVHRSSHAETSRLSFLIQIDILRRTGWS